MLGLTGKSVQNVLRSNPEILLAYVSDFELAINEAVRKIEAEQGPIRMTLGFVENKAGSLKGLGWQDITRLTTAIGSLTLTIRGSDKSIYGKLFERLVLGSVLSIFGLRMVNPRTNTRTRNVFWLSDRTDTRESDATAVLRPGKVARFDIGFIGPGNSEISKDKLTRYAREIELSGKIHSSNTFIIVDRLPNTSKTRQAARAIGAEIIQMSMQYWPRDLAQRLGSQLAFSHPIQTMNDAAVEEYMATKMQSLPIEDFMIGTSVENQIDMAIREAPAEYIEDELDEGM